MMAGKEIDIHMNQNILVTGATGTIGSQVLAALAQRGVSAKAGARGATNAALPSGITPVDLVLGDTGSVDRALEGVTAAFLLTPFSEDQVDLGTHFVDRAKAAGVAHIVKLSAIGSEIEPGIQLGRWHRAIERYLEASGLGYTILRPNNFMQNFIGFYPPDEQGSIYLPWGDGKCSFVDARDVGRVAAITLTETSKHEGKSYVLTGPSAFGIAEAATIIGKASGRKLTYVDVTEAAARSAMTGAGLPGWMVDAMLELHAIDKAGYAAEVNNHVAEITGTPARNFVDFAVENFKKA